MALFQPPSADGSSISLKTRSIMPSSRSSLLATWLYSDIASTPTAWASLRIESVSIPFSSAKTAAARSTRSRLNGMRGAGAASGVAATRASSSALRTVLRCVGGVRRNSLTYLQCTCSLHCKHTTYARAGPAVSWLHRTPHPVRGDPDDEPRHRGGNDDGDRPG